MGILLSVFCCCTSCLKAGGSCCFSAGSSAVAGSRQASKATYVMLILFSGLLAWILSRYGPDGDREWKQLDFRCGTDGDDVCSDVGIVYRISFLNVIFMSFMLLLVQPVPTCTGERRFAPLAGDGFHTGFWAIKLLLYLGLMATIPFLPSDMFDDPDNAYAWTARVLSGIFLILQTLLLIDFAYQLNEDWLARAYDGDEENKGWVIGLIVISLFLFLGGAGITAGMFLQYGGCKTGITFTIINIVAMVVYMLFTIFREKLTDQPGSIVPASVVFFFTSYQTWSATESLPDDPDCRPLDNGSDLIVFVGVVIAMLSLTWLAYTATRRTENLIVGDDGSGSSKGDYGGLYAVGNENGRDVMARGEEDPEAGESSNPNDQYQDSPRVFYVIMILASFYMAMILTNWGVVDTTNDNKAIGNVSAYVKISSAWLTILLYTWTLIAPRVLSGREFDF